MAYHADAIPDESSANVSQGRTPVDYVGLIERARQADRAASDLLADILYPKIWGVAHAYCTEDLWIEDLVQEAMLTIYGRLYRFDPTQPFLPWALRTAESRFKDMLRKLRSQQRKDNAVRQAARTRPGPPNADRRPGPEEELVRADEARRVREALTHLPKLERQIIALHWFSGLDYDEIAADLQLDKNEIYRLSYGARQRLGKMLMESEEKPS